ncbi:M56 family metallopeptidase [Filimonas effusa]|uniref:M56 family metallopeptidase n=1 Tax=Filimonas effusa TaxID=2508721 RepID=A0A4Q1DCA7_9BACT|nr:M56 family metallopeptidase [Filimonas effusa]RXK86243.1 M56 family metallopeptidase [Filimonas effusa]
MQALLHSPFLQALGYAIANSLWQAALLWLAVALITGLVPLSAAVKYRLALIAQLGAFCWFLITFKVYFQQCAVAASALESLNMPAENAWIVAPEATSFRSSLLAWTLKIEQLLPFLSIAYLFLLVFLGVKWIRTYRKAQQIRKDGLHKIDVEWRLFVQKVAVQLHIKPKVELFLSSVVNSPLTVGYLKPIILLPIASINHLTPQQLEALLLHELAHIKRGDYFINLIQSVIEITLFFNPFMQLLSRLTRKERENACDDWVLQFQYNPSMYAEALLRMAHLQAAPVLAMQASGNKGELLPRVKRMLNQQEKAFNYKQHLIALVVMTGVLSTIAWLQPGLSSYNQAGNGKTQQPVLLEPITARVDNPLFNPVFFLANHKRDEGERTHTAEKPAVKIRTTVAAAARYKEEPESTLATVIEESARIDSNILQPVMAEHITVMPLPNFVVQLQNMDMVPPAPEVFYYRLPMRPPQPGGRTARSIKVRIAAPPAPPRARVLQRADNIRSYASGTAASLRRTMDSAHVRMHHRNIDRAISNLLREIADSGRLSQSRQFRLLAKLPADLELLDTEMLERAFEMLERQEAIWAYCRPAVKEKDRVRPDVNVTIKKRKDHSTNNTNGTTAGATMLQQGTATYYTQPVPPPPPSSYNERQPQVVTYQYKDVMITISNSLNGVTTQSSQITIRKMTKEEKQENMLVDEKEAVPAGPEAPLSQSLLIHAD